MIEATLSSPNILDLIAGAIENVELIKTDRKRRRIENCGKWANKFDPYSGRRSGLTFRCGVFRECETCLEIRAKEEFENMLIAAHDGGGIVICRIDKDAATLMLRGVDKSDYIRYPTETEDVVFIREGYEISGYLLDVTQMTERDFMSVVLTPEGRKRSGTMCAIDPLSMEDKVLVGVPQFITDAPQFMVDREMDAVIGRTNDIDPISIFEIEEGISIRTSAVTTALVSEGYSVEIYFRKANIAMSEVKWKKELKKAIKSKTKEEFMQMRIREFD